VELRVKQFMLASGLALRLGLSAQAEPAGLAEQAAPADFYVAVSGKEKSGGAGPTKP
jgi:hypothetical protein